MKEDFDSRCEYGQVYLGHHNQNLLDDDILQWLHSNARCYLPVGTYYEIRASPTMKTIAWYRFPYMKIRMGQLAKPLKERSYVFVGGYAA